MSTSESLITIFYFEFFWAHLELLQLDIVDCPKVESDATPREKWLIDWEAWQEYYREPWYLNQEEEPLNHEEKSVLVRWLDEPGTEGGGKWTCRVPLKGETWCKHKIKRPDRAITHVRRHLNLRPYPCEGKCKNQIWYAANRSDINGVLIPRLVPLVSVRTRIVVLIIEDQTTESVRGGECEYCSTCYQFL